MRRQFMELQNPSHVLIGHSVEALGDARTAFKDISITAEGTPAQDELFYSVGNHFLMLGGNLRVCTEELATLAGVNLPERDEPISESTSSPAPIDGFTGELAMLRDLAIEIGRDDMELETPLPGDGESLTIQGKAEVILAKQNLLETYTANLAVAIEAAQSEALDQPELFLQAAANLHNSLHPKVTILDRYQELRHTPTGRRLNKIIWFNTIVGVGSVALLQMAERQSPGIGNVIREVPGFGWLFEQVLVPPYYKFGSALLAIANSPVPQKLLLSRDHTRDVIKFRRQKLDLPPEYIENLAPGL